MNLKTSSLRLFPLSVQNDDAPAESSGVPVSGPILPHDAPLCLEFQYDCDAPKCRISIDVYSKKRPDGKSSKTNVYSTVFDGGFCRSLKVEDGATLELSHILASLQNEGQQQSKQEEQPLPSSSTNAVNATAAAAAAPGEGTSTDASGGGPPSAVQETAPGNARKRLSALTFRRRHRPEVSGPALHVVDADAVSGPTTFGKQKNDVNVRVSITLEALDEEGNVQKTATISMEQS